MAPPVEWLTEWGHHRYEMWFPRTKRPRRVSAGDLAVIHGSRGRGFLAAVEVTASEPEANTNGEGRGRYPFVLKHRLLVAKAADTHVATPEVAGINVRRIQRGPHTEISRDEYERAVAVLLEAAAGSAGA